MTELFLADLQIVLRSYLITLAWGVIAWPFVSRIFVDLPDRGWALGRILVTLAISLVIWNLGQLGIRINTDGGVFVVSAILAIISILVFKRRKKMPKTDFRETLRFIVMEEYLFLVGFWLMAWVRGFAPEIRTLEKFMDYGFIRRYLMSPTLPTEDMWMAGQSINYYSFGHFWASVVIRFFRVEPAYGYNLVLALIAGLTSSMSFMVASNLTAAKEKARIIGGLVGSLAVTIGGNTHTVWYLLSHLGLEGYWYADATRFIYNTIHEFPSYSFVVSDLHGHLLDLPVVLAFLVIFVVWTREKKVILEALMGGLVGVMMMTNTWDVAVYGLLMTIYCVIALMSGKMKISEMARAASIILGTAAGVAVIWWIGFNSISNGIGIVQQRSPLWQLLVLWSGGIAAGILAVITKAKGREKLMWAIFLTIMALLIIPELIFARDIYPSHPRANTMFKLTYQAFIMMGLCLGAATGQAAGGWERKGGFRALVGMAVGIIFISGLLFPLEAFTAYYGNFKQYQGLDGERWMMDTNPDYYEAALFLRNNSEGKRIVEAVGDSYTEYNSVSVFSGVPTILGWRVHEWLWRGGYEVVGQRDEEVKLIYEGQVMEQTRALLDRYGVGWIVVGPNERQKYRINEILLLSLGKVAWEKNNVYLIKVD